MEIGGAAGGAASAAAAYPAGYEEEEDEDLSGASLAQPVKVETQQQEEAADRPPPLANAATAAAPSSSLPAATAPVAGEQAPQQLSSNGEEAPAEVAATEASPSSSTTAGAQPGEPDAVQPQAPTHMDVEQGQRSGEEKEKNGEAPDPAASGSPDGGDTAAAASAQVDTDDEDSPTTEGAPPDPNVAQPQAEEEPAPVEAPPVVRSQRWEAEHIKRIEADIAANLYNSDAWLALINEANRHSSDTSFLREAYERFLKIFPTAGRYWKQYAEHEMTAGNYANVENIFRRCLLTCPNMDLWRCYLTYIRLIKEGKPDERESVLRAFEFAIEHMGMDLNATHIWRDYIQYARAGPKPANQFEESQKVQNVRRLYQRAIESPINNLETLWKEYDAFESGVNKLLAKPLIAEYAGKYMTARAVCHERRGYVDGLQLNMLSVPPTHTPQEAHQVRLWRRFITFEKSNPERTPDERLRRRVGFTYNQALQCLYHFAEIWHEAAQYQLDNGAPEEGQAIYERAVNALPTNLFLHLAYADLLESGKRVAEAKEIYERIIQHTPGTNTLAHIHYLRFLRRTEGPDAARKLFVKAKKAPGTTYHLYVATAMMEYHANRNVDYARDVFNAGLKKFIGEPTYVLHYLRFLIQLNEDNNVRAVFERVIGSAEMAKERTAELWNALLEFEYAAGDLASIQKLEKRRAQIFPELEPASVPSLVQRYRFLDLWPSEPSEAYLPLSFGVAAGGGPGGKPDARDERPKVVARPDTTKMLAFRPELEVPPPPESRTIPALSEEGDGSLGTPFSPPPFSPTNMPMSPRSPTTLASTVPDAAAGPARLFAYYLPLFPPAESYFGPLVNLDGLITLLRQADIPPSALVPPPAGGGDGGARKRKANEEQHQHQQHHRHHPPPASGGGGGGGGPAPQNAPPARDIFRQRQAAKLTRFK